jgi:histidine triad (HIT) family protein
MPDCIFCKIIAKQIAADIIHEDEYTLAFLDIRPTNPGHTLVVPKKHARNIFDIAESDWLAVMQTVRRLAPVIHTAVAADGLNIHVNNEPPAGQVVFHSHTHLIPRFAGDGYELWHGSEMPEEERRRILENIRAQLQ